MGVRSTNAAMILRDSDRAWKLMRESVMELQVASEHAHSQTSVAEIFWAAANIEMNLQKTEEGLAYMASLHLGKDVVREAHFPPPYHPQGATITEMLQEMVERIDQSHKAMQFLAQKMKELALEEDSLGATDEELQELLD